MIGICVNELKTSQNMRYEKIMLVVIFMVLGFTIWICSR
jgi:hypothetical protein